jgi:hypothetical protein
MRDYKEIGDLSISIFRRVEEGVGRVTETDSMIKVIGDENSIASESDARTFHVNRNCGSREFIG